MDDQGKRLPERRAGDVQFHGYVRWHGHGLSCASPVSACRSLQALLSREHIPTLGARVGVHPRAVARPHDRVRENGTVTLGDWKLQRTDDGELHLPSRRDDVAGPEFREPHAAVFLHDDSGRTPGGLGGLSASERVEMPVDGRLTELEALTVPMLKQPNSGRFSPGGTSTHATSVRCSCPLVLDAELPS